jgi:branched-chain amino acid transport system substrate-binding protein
MKTSRRSLLKKSAATAATLAMSGAMSGRFATAQAEAVRIGVVYDLSGPFAAGGSAACAVGAQIAIDLVNERGGIAGKYKVIPINADCQSKVDVAINEVERLVDQEKVDIVNGVYASAQAVPAPDRYCRNCRCLFRMSCAVCRAGYSLRHCRPAF